MSYNKAINEIASILTQAGIPAGHSQDVAERLAVALSSYYDYRAGINTGTSPDGTIGPAAASSPAFQASYASPESKRTTRLGGGFQSVTNLNNSTTFSGGGFGTEGEAGQDGQQGADGQAGRDGSTANLSPLLGYLAAFKKAFDDLMKRVKSLEGRTTPRQPPLDTSKLKCSGGSKSICETLKDLKENTSDCDCKKINERLDEIEKMLKDTVECP